MAACDDALSVSGAFASERDPLAHLDVPHGGMHLTDDARAGVPEHRVLAELGFHLGEGANGPGNLRRRRDLPEMRRVVPQLGHDAIVMEARRFGAAADERVGRTYQHVMRRYRRIEHFLDDDVFQAFPEYLLHKSVKVFAHQLGAGAASEAIAVQFSNRRASRITTEGEKTSAADDA